MLNMSGRFFNLSGPVLTFTLYTGISFLFANVLQLQIEETKELQRIMQEMSRMYDASDSRESLKIELPYRGELSPAVALYGHIFTLTNQVTVCTLELMRNLLAKQLSTGWLPSEILST